MSFERLMSIAGTGMNAQLIRMNTTASNLANAGVVAGKDSRGGHGEVGVHGPYVGGVRSQGQIAGDRTIAGGI